MTADPFDEIPDQIPADWTRPTPANVRIDVQISGPADQVEPLLRRWFGGKET